MSVYVLDSCAIIAYLNGESGTSIANDVIKNRDNHCYVHSINLCEVFYDCVRESNAVIAEQLLSDLHDLGIIEQAILTGPFWRKVGMLKTKGRISLADCFCIALAKKLNATLLTSDRHEFTAVADAGIVPIQFIR